MKNIKFSLERVQCKKNKYINIRKFTLRGYYVKYKIFLGVNAKHFIKFTITMGFFSNFLGALT